MIKKSFIYFSLLLTFLGIYLHADEPLHAKGYFIPIQLNPGEHLLTGKSRDGKIQIENGLILKIVNSDEKQAADEWECQEQLSISDNPYLGGGSDFYVYNIDRDEFVHANFHSPPNKFSDHTKTVLHIDPFDGEVIVTTRTGGEFSWKVEEKDLEVIQEWNIEDQIFLGKNNHWFSRFFSDCPYIMINCNKYPNSPHIRVKPYQNEGS